VEKEIRVPINAEGDEFVCIPDLGVRMKRDGALWIIDHKTASKTGSSWWSQYYVDKQVTSLIWAVPEVKGVIINAVKPTKTEPFERQGFSRLPWQLKDFERQLKYEIEQMKDAEAAVKVVKESASATKEEDLGEVLAEFFPQRTQHCHKYGTCVFLPNCQVGEKAAGALYKQREVRA
jgi:hypothetical protein